RASLAPTLVANGQSGLGPFYVAHPVRSIWPFGVSAFRQLLLKRFLIHNIGHLGWVAPVVPFQDVDKCLGSAPSHAFVGIDREPCDLRATGKVMEQTRAVGDFGIEYRRIRRQRLFLK